MVSCLSKPRPNWASRERRWASLVVRQRAADDLQRRVGGVHRLDLVLVEPADLHAPARGACSPACTASAPADQLGEGRLAGAVDAQQADAVVDVEPQVQVAQDRLAAVADRRACSSRISGGASGRSGEGRVKGATRSSIDRRDRRQLGERLHARLGLGGLARPWRGSGRRRPAGGRARPRCLTRVAACSRSFSARRRSKSS